MEGHTLLTQLFMAAVTLFSVCGSTAIISPCVSNPCYNGGICHSLGHSYTCNCRDGFSGTRCHEHNIQRRLAGASANDIVGGQFGNISHNGTNGNYVHGQSTVGMGNANGNGNTGDNNGNTNISMSTFYCDCNSAFGRNRQDIGRTRCANNLLCYNRGSCFNSDDGSGNSYCSCPADLSGTQCQVQIKATPGSGRLVGGQKPWNGRLEIYEGEAWRTVCNTSWTRNNADVVCRQLGFRGVDDSYQRFGQGGEGQAMWSRNVQCFGGELRLADCPSTAVIDPCGHHNDVGVNCRPF